MDVAIADMFLKIPNVKGEARDADHKDEIEVVSWSWGAQTSAHGTGAQRSMDSLEIAKRVDSASTALLRCLAENLGTTARLVVRKAGKTPAEYFILEMEKVRVVSIKLATEDAELNEHVSLAFEKITVTYRQQAPDGSLGGAMTTVFDARATR
jgi:type VI secretion system secreted protein Hcp